MSLPIAEAPRLDGLTPARAAPMSFGEQVNAVAEQTRNIENFNARDYALRGAYADWIDDVEARTGERITIDDRGTPGDITAILAARRGEEGRAALAQIERRFEDIRGRNPDADLQPPSAIFEQVRRRLTDIDARAGQAEFLPGLVGGVIGTFTDPVALASLGVGGAGGARTIAGAVARAAGIDAAVNAGLEAVNIPVANRWRRELGLEEVTGGDAVRRVAAAGAFGAVAGGGLELGGQVARRGLSALEDRRLAQAVRELNPEDVEAERIASALERQAEIFDENPFEPDFAGAAEHRARLDAAMDLVMSRGDPVARPAFDRLQADGPAPRGDTALARIAEPVAAARLADDGRPGFAQAYGARLADEEARLSGVIEALQSRIARDTDPSGLAVTLIARRDPETAFRIAEITGALQTATGKQRPRLERELEQILTGFEDELAPDFARRAADREGLELRLASARAELRRVSAERRQSARADGARPESLSPFDIDPQTGLARDGAAAPAMARGRAPEAAVRAAPVETRGGGSPRRSNPPAPHDAVRGRGEGRFDGGPDDPALREQAEALALREGADGDEFDADLFVDDPEVRTGRRVTRAELRARLAAEDAMLDRFRGCVP